MIDTALCPRLILEEFNITRISVPVFSDKHILQNIVSRFGIVCSVVVINSKCFVLLKTKDFNFF